jgi:hypothetical protein
MTGLIPSSFDSANTTSLNSDPKLSLFLSNMAIDAKKLELLEQRFTGPPSQSAIPNPPNNIAPIVPTPFPAPSPPPIIASKSEADAELFLNTSDEEVFYHFKYHRKNTHFLNYPKLLLLALIQHFDPLTFHFRIL